MSHDSSKTVTCSETTPEIMRSRIDQLTRFERLQLKWNPFRVIAAYEKADVYLPDLYHPSGLASQVAKSDEPFTQVIADAGHGKSTFLAAVGHAFLEQDTPIESTYLQPTLLTRVQVPNPETRILILDEAERLTKRNLRKLIRWTERGGRLIVTSHTDLYCRAYARSASRKCARRNAATIRLPDVTAAGLQKLFRERVCWAAIAECRSELTTDGARWLLDASNGNLRTVEAILYELFQLEAESIVSDSDSPTGCRTALLVDERHLQKYSGLAKDLVCFEDGGNIPFSRIRLLVNAAQAGKDKTFALLSGQFSKPNPIERRFPNED
jgi:hypothetical protein